jgi:hypothetical protein
MQLDADLSSVTPRGKIVMRRECRTLINESWLKGGGSLSIVVL